MIKTNLLGANFSCVTMEQALQNIQKFLDEEKNHLIFTPNAEIMMAAQRDPQLMNILNSADMLVADGAGIILAAKILKLKIPEKVPGFDLTKNSMTLPRNTKIRYFFFGGKPGIAEEAARKVLTNPNNNIEVVGYHDGYFSPDQEQSIIDKINAANTEILVVALGAPKQEKWIYQNYQRLNVKICLGVGGTLDILSGNVQLTPAIFRDHGLEWLYRLYKEPWRFKRMLDLPKFILLAFKARLFGYAK